MGFRLIEKGAVPTNPAREDFAQYLASETGGFVSLGDGPILEYWDARYWRVPTHSPDGQAPKLTGDDNRPTFEVIAISTCGKVARLSDPVGFHFDSPRVVSAFGAELVGADLPETVTLEAGQIISGTMVGQNMLKDVYVVSGPGADVQRFGDESVGPNPCPTRVEEARRNYEEFQKALKAK